MLRSAVLCCLFLLLLCGAFRGTLCIRTNLEGLKWEKSRKFTEQIKFDRAEPLYVYNPTKTAVKLQFECEGVDFDTHEEKREVFERIVPQNANFHVEEAAGYDLVVVKVAMNSEYTGGGKAQISLLPYTHHGVIMVGIKGDLPGHVNWVPTNVAFGSNIWAEKKFHSEAFEALRASYAQRSPKLMPSTGIKAALSTNPLKKTRVPKIIHWVWLGGELSQLSAVMMRSVFQQHPDWSFKLWYDHSSTTQIGKHYKDVLEAIMGSKLTAHSVSGIPVTNTEFYKFARKGGHWAMCSDMIRISVLNEFGGVYLDHDVGAVASLNNLAKKFAFFAPMMLVNKHLPAEINNDVIGTAKGHKCIKAIYEQLMANVQKPDVIERMEGTLKKHKMYMHDFVFQTTGPTLVKDIVMSLLDKNKDMIVLPPSYLHGDYAGIQSFLRGDEFEDSFYGIYPETITFTILAGKWN